MKSASLSIELCGMKLRNPIILASGILGETGESLIRVARAGAGALTTKSIGLLPKTGHVNPTVVELEYGLLNSMGLPNPGIDEYGKEARIAVSSKIPVIGSVFGKDAAEFVRVAKKMESFGVSALELNVSCPHAKGYGAQIGQDPKNVLDITKEVKKKTRVPVFVKLTPNVADIASIAMAAEEGGADAVVAINTLKAMHINIDAARPSLANAVGGYSGIGTKPIGVRCVYEIAQEVDLPIIGLGGINSGRDAIEYMMAGASAVQVGTAVWHRGVSVFSEIEKEMGAWLKKNKYQSVEEIIGIAHVK